MKISEFINEFKKQGIKNTQFNPDAVEKFIREKLEIKTYLPFNTKRQVVEMVVNQCINYEDGGIKVDSIAQYLSFIVSMLATHTNLEFGTTPAEDYDELSASGLLEPIIATFQKDYTECEALLKMALADAFQDNNFSIIVGKFLDGVLDKLDGFTDVAKNFMGGIDVQKLLGVNMNEEEKAKILGFVDKFIK